jgi:hypothetical protein
MSNAVYPSDDKFWNGFETNICMVDAKKIEDEKKWFGTDLFCENLMGDIKKSLELFIIDKVNDWIKNGQTKNESKEARVMYLSPSDFASCPIKDSSQKILDITKDDYCLSFNYSDLPSIIYHMPELHFLPIHGSAFSHYYLDIKNKAIVFGHEENAFNYVHGLANSDPAYSKFIHNSEKPVSEIIRKHSDFFNRIRSVSQEITEVVIFGCSFSIVDAPYFTEVINSLATNPSILFRICYHDEKDLQNFKINYANLFKNTNYRLVQSKTIEIWHLMSVSVLP